MVRFTTLRDDSIQAHIRGAEGTQCFTDVATLHSLVNGKDTYGDYRGRELLPEWLGSPTFIHWLTWLCLLASYSPHMLICLTGHEAPHHPPSNQEK